MRTVVITKVLNEPAFRAQYQVLLQILGMAFPDDLMICFGFGWEAEFSYLEKPIKAPEEFQKLVGEAEAAQAGKLGNDNLHVYWEGKSNELILCHESDIHLIFEHSSELIESILEQWKKDELIRYQGEKG